MKLRLAAIACLFAAALAAPAAAQINLSWDDCGAAGTALKTWACDANPTVVARLYVSFVVTPGMSVSALTGMESTLDLYAPGGTLPAWWDYGSSGTCRPGGTGMAWACNMPCTSVPDYWGSIPYGPAGGSAFYYATSPGQAYLRTVQAIDYRYKGSVGPGEYYGYTITIKGTNTVGPGSCAGCASGIGLALRSVTLTQPVGVGDYVLTTAADRQWVTWQAPPSGLQGSGFPVYAPTPAKQKTWGQIKALYR